MGTFGECFGEVCDPRGKNALHDFTGILFIALAAILCGAQSCVDMADFARAKRDALGEVLDLKHGTPSHDTFSRVFRALDPVSFEAGFRRFMAAFGCKITGVVAVDGKAVRGAYAHGRKATPLHLVNVWAAEARLVLAQATAPGRNEVQGVLDVLGLLALDGCTVTVDALHCRRDVAQAILATGADYLIACKANQPGLHATLRERLASGGRCSRAESGPVLAHGRLESRSAVVMRAPDIGEKHDFPGLCAIACVTAQRQTDGHDSPATTRFFLLSKPIPAKRLLKIVRQHWHIENRLHWVLDVALGEDRARNRKDNGPENLAILRKIALNLLQTHPEKASINRKIKRAGWENAFLFSLLANMR
jgi:predicted transposase YbfD/YdcC